MENNVYKRLARVEALAEAEKAKMTEALQAGYDRACAEKNEEDAAVFCRRLRDKLLADSDNRVALDRFNISVPSGGTFTAWLTFLKSLGGIISGEWAVYRQRLRDLPEQAGFPFEVDFPTPPDGEGGGDDA